MFVNRLYKKIILNMTLPWEYCTKPWSRSEFAIIHRYHGTDATTPAWKHGNGRSTLEGPGVRKLADAVLYISPEEKSRQKQLEKTMKISKKQEG